MIILLITVNISLLNSCLDKSFIYVKIETIFAFIGFNNPTSAMQPECLKPAYKRHCYILITSLFKQKLKNQLYIYWIQ